MPTTKKQSHLTLLNLSVDIWSVIIRSIKAADLFSLFYINKSIRHTLLVLSPSFDKQGRLYSDTPLLLLLKYYSRQMNKYQLRYTDLVDKQKFIDIKLITKNLNVHDDPEILVNINHAIHLTKNANTILKKIIINYLDIHDKKWELLINNLTQYQENLINDQDADWSYQSIRKWKLDIKQKYQNNYIFTDKKINRGFIICSVVTLILLGLLAMGIGFAAQTTNISLITPGVILSIALAIIFVASCFVTLCCLRKTSNVEHFLSKHDLTVSDQQHYEQIIGDYAEQIDSIKVGELQRDFNHIENIVWLFEKLIENLPLVKGDLVSDIDELLRAMKLADNNNKQLAKAIKPNTPQENKIFETDTLFKTFSKHVLFNIELSSQVKSINNRYQMWQSQKSNPLESQERSDTVVELAANQEAPILPGLTSR